MAAVTRPDWDEYFLGVAQAVSARGDCTRQQVGCVIVKHNRIISTGYNGAPSGGPSCLAGDCPRGRLPLDRSAGPYTGPGACIALHAEQNAIIYSRFTELLGSTLYVTDQPCDNCTLLIRGAGITKIIYQLEGGTPYAIH